MVKIRQKSSPSSTPSTRSSHTSNTNKSSPQQQQQQQYHTQPATQAHQAPPVAHQQYCQTSGGSSMMRDIATTAAGSFIGGTMSRMVYGAISGGSNNENQVENQQQNQQAQQPQQQQVEEKCFRQNQAFVNCLQANNNNSQFCQYDFENLVNCKNLHYANKSEKSETSGFF